MKDIGEVIRAKQSQRDRLGREIEVLQQAIILLNEDAPVVPPQIPNPSQVKQWP